MTLFSSIRARLILLVLLLLVPATLLILWSAHDRYDLRLADTKRTLTTTARLAREKLQNDIREMQRLIVLLNQVAAVREFQVDECSQLLASLLTSGEYANLLAMDTKGDSNCAAVGSKAALPNSADRDYFGAALRSPGPVVGKPMIGRVSGKASLPASVALKSLDGKTVGVLVATLDLSTFSQRFLRTQPSSDATFLLWDRSGNVLFRYPDVEKIRGKQFADLAMVKQAATLGSSGVLELPGFDGVQRIIGFAALDEFTDTGMYVGVNLPASSVYAPAESQLKHTRLGVLLMAVFGLVVAWLVGRNLIWRPAKALTRVSQRLAQGDFSARVGAPYSRSELGELTKVFDQMAQTAENGRTALLESNRTLEQRVIERTASLEASEHKFRSVLESAADGLVIVDAQGHIAIVNAKTEALFGYDRVELIGQSLELLVPPAFKAAHRAQQDAYRAELVPRGMGERGVIKALRKDGSEFFVGISLSPVATEEGTWVTAVVRDITTAIHAEIELKRLNRTLRVLSQCNQALVRAQDEAGLLEAICQAVVDFGGYKLAWVGFALHDEGRTVIPVSQYGAHEGYLEHLHICWADTPWGRGPGGTAIRERHTTIIHGLSGNETFGPWQQLARAKGFNSCVALPLKTLDGTVLGILSLYSDVLEAFNPEEIKLLEELADDLSYGIASLRESAWRVGAERQLDYQANFDAVTGLANRALLLDRLGQALVHAERNNRLVAVVLVDMDRFNAVNETHGHACGDRLLKEMGQRLVAVLREGDTVGRMAADEFGVLLADLASADDAAALTHKLLQAIAVPLALECGEIFMTASAGISLFPKDSTAALALLQHAMSAMHSAKSLGGNTFHFYSPEMNQHVASRLALDGALRRSLERGELQVHYQPVVNLMTGEVVSAEALVRWPHPEMGMISPVDFIPLAEETGLIVPLGSWVLNHTCQQMRAWLDAGLPVPPVAVNLSARQFRQDDLVQVVQAALQDNALEPAMLTLEITESTIMVDIDKAVVTLRQLKGLGVKLSLDDFGTGYSSLSYLKRFPTDRLKIDRSFVRDITTDADDAAICKAVIGLAHTLKMKVIAEGVETEGQMNYLRGHFCDEMQGYYFSRPLAPADFAQLLSDGKKLDLTGASAQAVLPTLLLVDDEENVLSALNRMLRRGGYRILTATTAAQAFDLLAVNDVQVILSDQRMQEISGTEFLRRVKELYPDTVRMMLSGYTDLNSVTQAINQGAIHKFFTKPWDETELQEEIRDAFRYYAQRSDRQ